MKIKLMLFLLFGLALSSFAQRDLIQWGEEYEDRGYYSIIGESEDAFFVERKYNARSNNRNLDLEVMRFDKSLQLTHAVQLRDLEEGSYESIATINSPEGLAHIYYQTTNRGDQYVSAQLFDHKSLRKTEIVDLAKFKINKRSQPMIRQDGNFQYSYPLDIILSRDRSKLAIFYDQEKAGKNKRYYHQYCVIDLMNGFSILHKGDFYSDERSNRYLFSDKHLSNSGKLTYALKRFVKDNETEHINKKPAYAYEIHHMSGDSMEYIYDIKVRKEFMDGLTLGSDNEDNLYIAGYLRKQPFGDITHSFFMSLDEEGYERYTVKEKYSRRDIKTIQGKEDNELDQNYETLAIFPTDDIIYLTRQYRRRGSRNNNINPAFNNGFNRGFNNGFNNITYFWDYEHMVVEGIGKATGEILWTAVNPREHEDDDTYSRYFISGQIKLMKNNLVFVYNEREENVLKARRKEDLKRTDIPGDRTAITLARVNSTGDIQYTVLEEEDHFHLPERGSFLGDSEIYFFNQNKNYNNFFVGKAPASILDF